MSVSLFDLRTLIGVVQRAPRVGTYLRDTYFPNVKTFATKEVDIDIVDQEKRQLAAFVHPRSGGSFSYRQGYETRSYRPAAIAPKIPTDADEILTRQPGETLYSPLSPEQRAQRIIADNLQFLDRQITRREEWMCSQALFTGKIAIKGEGVDDIISFWPSDENKQPYTEVATKWGTSGADPLGDLDAAVDACGDASGLTPVRLLMGTKAAKALMQHLLKDGILDDRRIDLGHIQPSDLGNGVRYLGTLRYPQLDLYTYTEKYLDDETGKLVPFVPENLCLLSCNGASTLRAYGIVNIIDGHGNEQWIEGDRVPNSWVQRDNPAGRVVQMTSHPLMVVNEPQAFHVLKVLA